MKNNVLHFMIDLAYMVGTVTGVHMYSNDFVTVEGNTEDGKPFSVTLSIKEEKTDGN